MPKFKIIYDKTIYDMKELRYSIFQSTVETMIDSVGRPTYNVIRIPVLKGIDVWDTTGILVVEELEID